MSDRAFEKECIEKFGVIEGQIGIVRNEQEHMKQDMATIKIDICKIKDKVVKACINNASTKGESKTWIWINRTGMAAIITALVTKLFALW